MIFNTRTCVCVEDEVHQPCAVVTQTELPKCNTNEYVGEARLKSVGHGSLEYNIFLLEFDVTLPASRTF